MSESTQNWLISWPNLEGLLAEGNSFRMLVAGSQHAWIGFDAPRSELVVEIEQVGTGSPKVLPQAIEIRVRPKSPEKSVLVLATRNPDLRRYFYDFVVEVLDLTQKHAKTASIAVDEAWKRWGQLIEQQSVLSREKQVGLIGEVQVLQRLAKRYGWKFALDAWHKEPTAEHDFCLTNVDVEVKTTASEKRIHTIGSLDQLLGSPGRALYLLSIQVTPAPPLAADSFSLRGLVTTTFDALASNDELTQVFKRRIQSVGWSEHHVSYYESTYVSRSPARLILVDDACPRITSDKLFGMVGELASRITGVMYSIDVTDLGHVDGSDEFGAIIS